MQPAYGSFSSYVFICRYVVKLAQAFFLDNAFKQSGLYDHEGMLKIAKDFAAAAAAAEEPQASSAAAAEEPATQPPSSGAKAEDSVVSEDPDSSRFRPLGLLLCFLPITT